MASFSLRDFDVLLADFSAYFQGTTAAVTDFTEGSVLRTVAEAVSLELARLYYNAQVGLAAAQEQATYVTFGFPPLPATPAYGRVSFRLTAAALATGSSVALTAGQSVSVNGDGSYRYTLLEDLTLSADAPDGEVVVQAVFPGVRYNVDPGVINTFDGTNSDLLIVTNPRAFITGSDAESDLQRRDRFGKWVVGIQRATKEAILYGVKGTQVLDPDGYVIEQVIKASTIEVSPGRIYVYVHNGQTGASQALLDAAQAQLSGYVDTAGLAHPGWKAAGIIAEVFPATEEAVAVIVHIEVAPGRVPDVVQTKVEQAIERVFDPLDIGDPLRLQNLLAAIRQTPGVLDIVQLATPSYNVTPSISGIVVPGTIQVVIAD